MPTKIDSLTWVAVGCVVLGWFWLDTLAASFGPVHNTVRFYDLPVVMHDPRWLLSGVRDAYLLARVTFGLVCLVVITAPLLPRLGFPHVPCLLSSAPFLLMLLCGIVLYVKSSSTQIAATDSLGRIGGYLAKWANGATNWTGDVVARHIAIGGGGYLAFGASGFLAVRGVLRPRQSTRAISTLLLCLPSFLILSTRMAPISPMFCT
jgi:hypothetical protein